MSTLVSIESGGLNQLDDFLPTLKKYSQLVLISHPELEELYRRSAFPSLKKFNLPILELLIPKGEGSKNLIQVNHCWKKMIAKGVDRQGAIIAFGGGVICDLAGFIASCYMRGIDSYYLPTTLLAMVDAAYGGKTGFNLRNRKNIIGSFHPPKQILIDPNCLQSLPQREFNSGVGEIIKYAVIASPHLFEELEDKMGSLETRENSFLKKVITHCIEIKKEMISEDPYDLTGKRAFLNYGHTFGHALESVTKYKIYLHGEAISIGMSCAAHLSGALSLCDQSLINRQDRLCKRIALPLSLPRLSIESLLKGMQGDKKTRFGKINLILLEKIGKVVRVCNVDTNLIKQTLLAKMS